jgi:hypothetical protein
VYLPKSVRDVLNIRIIVPTEIPGIATTVQSRGLSDERLVTGFYAVRYKIGVHSFGRRVDVATPELGYR